MKNAITFLILFSLSISNIKGQRTIDPADTLFVKGKIKKEVYFTASSLDTFACIKIKDQIIYNHKGEIKDTLKNIKGVSFKTVFSSIEFLHDKPKNLNEFYFVFTASDGYKVVFSWNEIYNTEVGNSLFFVTEINGKRDKFLDQRILLLSSADLKSGRRYIKGLKTIEVKQAE